MVVTSVCLLLAVVVILFDVVQGFDEELAHRESNREHEIVKQFLDAAKLDVYSEQFKANSLNVLCIL